MSSLEIYLLTLRDIDNYFAMVIEDLRQKNNQIKNDLIKLKEIKE